MSIGTWMKGIGSSLLVLVAVAFTLQNQSRATSLSLDLYVGAWRLAEPVPVPWLMWGCFGGGLVVAGAWGWLRGISAARRVRQLEQQLATSGARAPKDDWVRAG
jgi:hypothetical protein